MEALRSRANVSPFLMAMRDACGSARELIRTEQSRARRPASTRRDRTTFYKIIKRVLDFVRVSRGSPRDGDEPRTRTRKSLSSLSSRRHHLVVSLSYTLFCFETTRGEYMASRHDATPIDLYNIINIRYFCFTIKSGRRAAALRETDRKTVF